MIDLIKNNLPQIKTICEKHYVKSLHLFGSATKDNFDPISSDLDFVVEFNQDIDPLYYADNFFSLMDSLKDLLHKEIDLLSYNALKNKIIISEIENSKVQMYYAA